MSKISGVTALLKAAMPKTSEKAKNGISIVALPTDLHSVVNQWIEGKDQETRGESFRKNAEAKLTPFANELLLTHSLRAHAFLNSLRLSGDNNSVMFVRKNQFCKIGETKLRTVQSAEDTLLNIFGDTDYNRYFVKQNQLSIDVGKLTDTQAKAIVKALGAAATDLLTVETVIKPVEQFAIDCVFNATLREKQKSAEREGLCVPVAPSYRK